MTEFLNLTPRFVYGDLDLTDHPFAVNQEGIDYQSGDLVISVLSSFIQDGDLEVSQRRGNMTLVIPVLVEGTDLLDLAQSEAALAIEAQKATNTLTIDPGDGFGPPTVFDTFSAQDVAYVYNANYEQMGYRQFNVTMTALPFGRSATPVITAAISGPTSPVETSMNDASSAVGWTSAGGTAPTFAGGLVRTTSTGPAPFLSVSGASTAADTPFVFVDWVFGTINVATGLIESNGATGLQVFGATSAGVVAGEPVGTVVTPGGLTRSYFRFSADITSISAGFTSGAEVGQALGIDQVSKTNVPPNVGTSRQQARTAEIAGSARTPAAIQVYSPTTGLGDVLIYSNPIPYTPAVRSYGPSGTADLGLYSGQYNTLSSAFTIDVPAERLPPGLYGLVARVSSPVGSERVLNWCAFGRMVGTTIGRTLSGSVSMSGADYQMVPLGTVDLPTIGFADGSIGVQRFTLVDASGTDAARLDEFYVCNLSTGRLTIVRCGSGTPSAGSISSRLWIEAATVTSRTAQVLIGTRPDAADAYFAGDAISSSNRHEFSPPLAGIFTACGAPDAEVSLRHFPRFFGHATQ